MSGVEWRYLPSGLVKHALQHGVGTTAVCGARPWWAEHWRGAGSQAEYQTLVGLRQCKRCVRILAPPAVAALPPDGSALAPTPGS